MTDTSSPVLVFDGVCNFCNSTVNFFMKQDKKGVLKFTANQNEAGQQILKDHNRPVDDVDTFYFLEDGFLYDRSSAILRVAKYLGFPYTLAAVFFIVPKFLRDPIYKFIAKNRYKWFGKKEACRIPTPEERARFLA